jgi:hypothetical protein
MNTRKPVIRELFPVAPVSVPYIKTPGKTKRPASIFRKLAMVD